MKNGWGKKRASRKKNCSGAATTAPTSSSILICTVRHSIAHEPNHFIYYQQQYMFFYLVLLCAECITSKATFRFEIQTGEARNKKNTNFFSVEWKSQRMNACTDGFRLRLCATHYHKKKSTHKFSMWKISHLCQQKRIFKLKCILTPASNQTWHFARFALKLSLSLSGVVYEFRKNCKRIAERNSWNSWNKHFLYISDTIV